MTDKFNIQFVLQIFVLLIFCVRVNAQTTQTLKADLEKLPGVRAVEPLACDTFFTEKYLLTIDQPVNHKKPKGAVFQQRVFVGFRGKTLPTVFVTEGYAAGYAGRPDYLDELCLLLNANVVVVEHRYFGKSIPIPLDWKYLTVKQAAADHHAVNQLMKKIFNGKFVSTGISKGGQTTMYYRYFYPNDADVAVPYVGPLNFSIDDPRINPFINNIGSADCRQKILEFQVIALERKEALMEDFKEIANRNEYHFSIVGSPETAYEYTVLEYPFAFWQWGFVPCSDIPDRSATDSIVLKHLVSVSPMDYFADEGIRQFWPFFYQALTEIGYYGYDTTGMGQYFDHVTDLTFSFCAPEGTRPKFDARPMKKVDKYLKNKGNNMIYIYGEYDPWSATAFVPDPGKTNALKVVKKGGSHGTRIKNLPEDQQNTVLDSLSVWLNIRIDKSVLK